MIVGAILSVAMPSISANFAPAGNTSSSSGVSIPRETAAIELPASETLKSRLPALMLSEDGESIEINPWLALAALAGATIAGIAIIGGGLSFITRLLDRQTADLKASEEYQSSVKAFAAAEKERLKAINADAPLTVKTDEDYVEPRWSVFSTAGILLTFVAFAATAVASNFFPEGEMHLFGRQWNAIGFFILAGVLIALGFMLAYLRFSALDAINDEEAAAIPWDLIYLLITGFVVIVGGVGLLLYFSPSAG